MLIKRGDIYLADLSGIKAVGSEQSGNRPVIVIQNDIGNKYSPNVIVAEITSSTKPDLPSHMYIDLLKPSTIMLEQIKTISKMRLKKKLAQLPVDRVKELDDKLAVCLGIKSGR